EGVGLIRYGFHTAWAAASVLIRLASWSNPLFCSSTGWITTNSPSLSQDVKSRIRLSTVAQDSESRPTIQVWRELESSKYHSGVRPMCRRRPSPSTAAHRSCRTPQRLEKGREGPFLYFLWTSENRSAYIRSGISEKRGRGTIQRRQ